MNESNKTFDIKDIIPKLNQIVSAVSNAVETGTLEEVLKKIADFNRSLINAKYAAIGVPNGKGEFLYFQVSGLTDEEQDRLRANPPQGLGLLGMIMAEKRTLLVDTIISDPRSAGFPEGHPEMKHLLGVPIRIGNQLLGILYLTDREDGQPFEEEDQLITEIMAGYAALAIAGSNLSEQKERIALLEERERIAMELHDGIIQSLYGIGMQMEIARSDGEFDMDEVKDVITSLDDVINDIRFYIRDLRLTNYQQLTLRESLMDMLTRLHIPPSISLVLEVPHRRTSLSPTQLEGISHITVEAVSNAIRHANATEIVVKASEEAGLFTLIVKDDGQGFNAESELCRGDGMGLNNIKHRVALYGGKFAIDSAVQKGTTIRIDIPIS